MVLTLSIEKVASVSSPSITVKGGFADVGSDTGSTAYVWSVEYPLFVTVTL